jgi:hypothetical protein
MARFIKEAGEDPKGNKKQSYLPIDLAFLQVFIYSLNNQFHGHDFGKAPRSFQRKNYNKSVKYCPKDQAISVRIPTILCLS